MRDCDDDDLLHDQFVGNVFIQCQVIMNIHKILNIENIWEYTMILMDKL